MDVWRNKWDVISLNHLLFFLGLLNDIDLRQTP